MLNKIYHLGYAVEDIEAASRFYRENFSAEPTESEVVGEQGIIAAMFRVGESMVELVQPTGPDTPVGRFLARRGEGFHHVAYEVDDLEDALRELRQIDHDLQVLWDLQAPRAGRREREPRRRLLRPLHRGSGRGRTGWGLT